jgi:hypothetical protein
MRTRLLLVLLASGLLALAAWLVHEPDLGIQTERHFEKDSEIVSRALKFLAGNQRDDGHWEGDGGQHPVAMTGLVSLALLMERKIEHTQGERRIRFATYSANFRTAADWLMQHSHAGREGLIFSGHPSETARYMQGHGLAVLFLAGVYKHEHDNERRAKLAEVLQRAVKYTVSAQSSQGGWYETSRVEGHDFATIQATVIQVQSLQAAENAGISVGAGVIGTAQAYLQNAIASHEEKAEAGENRSRLADTAAALACHSREIRIDRKTSLEVNSNVGNKWFAYCRAEVPVGGDVMFGRDELTHYYYAQAVFQFGNNDWCNCYRTIMNDCLASTQDKYGSWPASEGIGIGRVYSTALWCVGLQLDRNSHPSLPDYLSFSSERPATR